ncbi:Asparagine synthetase [Enhygromyxa salina]|uniref:asparagine synthase (glutamine-hydrolyzing) n=1 Tax=Enhygromyxa salina TaxID=215803 RepID=A0A0C2DIQ1_9BACT|nr:asparagine synthase-related protein [Enhygromyxa salina]KIG19562.1 Asparagine synthetase [Enhygromyxa salina]
MSGISGWVGAADPATLDLMLDAIGHRGDQIERAFPPGAALGYRSWRGRPGQAASILARGPFTIACAGDLAPTVPCPAHAILDCVQSRDPTRNSLDGSFAAAAWDHDAGRLTIICDPFGLRSIYWVEHRGVVYFASELKQLLAIPTLPVQIDPQAIHSYLTFSFVAGDRMPVQGVRRVSPGRISELQRGAWTERPYLRLVEALDPALEDDAAATAAVEALSQAAVKGRLPSCSNVGLYLSGGLDSSAIGRWLYELNVPVRAYTLDFGEHSVERDEAALVAKSLGLPLSFVDASPDAVAPILSDLAWRMDLPFGDGVTGPHYLLARAASGDGITAVFNGEGGDQLFGGWTNKPMIAAEVYTPTPSARTRARAYLGAYHRFYRLEDDLYTQEFAATIHAPAGTDEPDERLALLERELDRPGLTTFMGRLRNTDIAIKGFDNIMPRAERIAGSFGLDVRSPLFDRALTEHSFTLHPRHKLQGVCEKAVLKRAMSGRLPSEIVWRQKSGMCVPTTDWVLGPLHELARELLGPNAVARRGLFRPAYIARLRAGRDLSHELRPRRIGEKLWALLMLELWMRAYIDGRGKGQHTP